MENPWLNLPKTPPFIASCNIELIKLRIRKIRNLLGERAHRRPEYTSRLRICIIRNLLVKYNYENTFIKLRLSKKFR